MTAGKVLMIVVIALHVPALSGCGILQKDRVRHARHHTPLTDGGLGLTVAPSGDAVGLHWEFVFAAVAYPSTGRLAALPGPREWAGSLSWSPDGRKFTCVQLKREGERLSTRVVWFDTEKLTPHGVTPWSHTLREPTLYSFALWSDNAEHIYYQALDGHASLMDLFSIHLARLKGETSRAVVGSLIWVWRCNAGNRLLFRGPRVGGGRVASKQRVYVLDLATSARHEVLPDERVHSASLSPCGNYVAALCNVSEVRQVVTAGTPARLMLAEIDSPEVVALAEGTFASRFFWSPDGSMIALSSLTEGTIGESADDWVPLVVDMTGERVELPGIGRGCHLQWSNDGTMWWISVEGVMSMDPLGKQRTIVRFPLELPE